MKQATSQATEKIPDQELRGDNTIHRLGLKWIEDQEVPREDEMKRYMKSGRWEKNPCEFAIKGS